jgi:hypothetical protein
MELIINPPARPPSTPADVADVLAAIAVADRRLAEVLKEIGASQSPVSSATVLTLEGLLTALRPAASEREQLALVDRRTLRAGIRLWTSRQLAAPHHESQA